MLYKYYLVMNECLLHCKFFPYNNGIGKTECLSIPDLNFTCWYPNFS